MEEIDKQKLIEDTVKSWMSNDEITIDDAVKEAEELTNTKVAIMANILGKVDKQKAKGDETLKDLYANKIVFELLKRFDFILKLNDRGLPKEEYMRLLSIINTYIIELRKDKKTLAEIKKAIMRLATVQSLQCNSRLMLLLQLLEDKRVAMVENYNHEHTLSECRSSGINYVSGQDVRDRTKEMNKNILTLRLSLGLKENK